MSKKYVMGDLHGRYNSLISLLKKVDFDYENDTLIQLGDIFDRGTESYKCIFELLKIKNLIPIKGNHDMWAYDWIKDTNKKHFLFDFHLEQIKQTITQWFLLSEEEQSLVRFFLLRQKAYYIDEKSNLFVHAGLFREDTIENQTLNDLALNSDFFDREVMSMQRDKRLTKVPTANTFNEIYVGHVPTINYKKEKGVFRYYSGFNDKIAYLLPMNILNVWNMDTGAGFSIGRLSIMDIETKEVTQVIIKDEE